MLEFLELEEMVGRRWHRLVGNAASWQRFPDHAVALDAVRGPLAVFFRGLGGASGIALAGAGLTESGHRLSFRQRLGLDTERLDKAVLDGNALRLPVTLDVFPDPALNGALYVWLAAFFAFGGATAAGAGGLAGDLTFLADIRRVTARVLAQCPGLMRSYQDLCRALLELRPSRSLPPLEAEVEKFVRRLAGAPGDGGMFWTWDGGPLAPTPRGYKPFLPMPVWGETIDPSPSPRIGAPLEDAPKGGSTDANDGRVRKARRESRDQADRKDSLLLNRFEKIMTLIESLDINRAVDDDDEDGARKALADADNVVVSASKGKPSTRLKFDLDLPPNVIDEAAIRGEYTYPEWHCGKQVHLPDHCRVIASTAPEMGDIWSPSDEAKARIRQVRRQFEALRPRPEILRAQVDGDELDMDALIRSRGDLRATGMGSDRIRQSARRQGRDVAVTLLVDVSLSTDAWIDNRRVLDVEKEALTVLAHGLSACGDDHSILTFTSRRRDWVRVETVKDFDEALSAKVERRISALKPGYYTRIGAALRHATAMINQRPNRHRLVIVLTDGKPNDVDHYEGRHGVEDTRHAVLEARRSGIAVFGVTIDRQAQEYFPALFGRGGYAIIDRIQRLPAALPSLYRHLVGR